MHMQEKLQQQTGKHVQNQRCKHKGKKGAVPFPYNKQGKIQNQTQDSQHQPGTENTEIDNIEPGNQVLSSPNCMAKKGKLGPYILCSYWFEQKTAGTGFPGIQGIIRISRQIDHIG